MTMLWIQVDVDGLLEQGPREQDVGLELSENLFSRLWYSTPTFRNRQRRTAQLLSTRVAHSIFKHEGAPTDSV